METTVTTPVVVPVKKEPTISERLMADSPKFFKIVEIIGYVILVAMGALTESHILPVNSPIVLILGSVATAMVGVSKFAVKDAAAIQQGPVTIDKIADILPQILDQYNQVKDDAKKPFVPEPLSQTIDSLNEAARPEGLLVGQIGQVATGIASATPSTYNVDSLLLGQEPLKFYDPINATPEMQEAYKEFAKKVLEAQQNRSPYSYPSTDQPQ